MEAPGSHAQNLSINTEIVRRLLVEFIRDETRNAGFQKAVIGLSGGVDSALSAFLSAEALGKQNVRGIIMPHETSSPRSKEDAELVARTLDIQTEVVEIASMVRPYLQQFGVQDRVRTGNVIARERMIVLYDISFRDSALVVGTSNKTESLLGYGTLFGDMACALNPLGDLYKTQVWQLAEYVGIPRGIVEKTPSADLWAGQTDEAEIGFPYREVDRLLYYMVDERRQDEELLAMGFHAPFVSTIKGMIRKNQFKRRPPLVAKVSNRTTNVDFRYARDWGI